MATSAGNTSDKDDAITMASPSLNAATPTPAAPTLNTSKPLPPRPGTTKTAATKFAASTTPKTSTPLPSVSAAPKIKIKTKPGASIYSKPLMLTTYDKYVLGFSMTHLWRCPSSAVLVPFFRQNFRAGKHLDIGVGTGFFVADSLTERLAKDEDLMPLERDPDRKLVQPRVDITLMDLNGKALEMARKRVMGVVDKWKARVNVRDENGNGKTGKGKSGKGKNGNGKSAPADNMNNMPILGKPARPKANVSISVTTIQADVLDESLTLTGPGGSKLFSDGPDMDTDFDSASNSDGTSRSKSTISRHSFQSVSMFNLLHCLPSAPSSDPEDPHGSHGQEIKNRTFKLAAECLADDGVLAGCTILGRKYISGGSSSMSRPSSSGTGSGSGSGVKKNGKVKGAQAVHGRTTTGKKPSAWSKGMTWSVMKCYNATGVFGNWADEREMFERGLRENFEFVETRLVGCMLLFNAKGPKRGVDVDVDVE
ncbi:hypothetical protein B0T09DRAFT_159185 [Sordaria sp. MPI-SDFR-AT-0083]|nr:hypothetical protein B0T09DRAFT_159185 [Sordaria sp. MPI-SDFR-AT-0083]